MFDCKRVVVVSAAILVSLAAAAEAAKYDPRMALENSVTEKGVQARALNLPAPRN